MMCRRLGLDVLFIWFANDLQSKFRLLLTGTPVQNNVEEIFALLLYCMPSIFRGKIEVLEDVFKYGPGACCCTVCCLAHAPCRLSVLDCCSTNTCPRPLCHAGRTTVGAEDYNRMIKTVQNVLAPFVLRRLKSKVMVDVLPPKIYEIEHCKMVPAQAHIHRRFAV